MLNFCKSCQTIIVIKYVKMYCFDSGLLIIFRFFLYFLIVLIILVTEFKGRLSIKKQLKCYKFMFAGWVVAGLELLGAPGALAARVGGATGGVRGVATATAAAVLRSLSAWADSLARNLDILAGDEEHTKRAAAARRRPPDSLVAGLKHGFTNFAINILGIVFLFLLV